MSEVETVFFQEARRSFHKALLDSILKVDDGGFASNADSSSKSSNAIALGIIKRLGPTTAGARLAGQTAGKEFEEICKNFLNLTFSTLTHIRPGEWIIKCVGGRNRLEIANYEQYSHLRDLDEHVLKNPTLQASLGNDYTITPDVVVLRQPISDEELNRDSALVNLDIARLTGLRKVNNGAPFFHASISCKWTLRSDRAQNARSEALNLIRNRKGRLPHVVVVTGEPTIARIASLALGTGDLDCVYHFALPELIQAVDELGKDDSSDFLKMMVEGKRLKDIADLPLDLAT